MLNYTAKLSISAPIIPIATVCGLLFATGESAQAATFALNEDTTVDTFTECINDGIALQVDKNSVDESGWQYAVDSFNDGVDGLQVGGSGNPYEIHSLALKETEDSIFVAINANMSLTGVDGTSAEDGNIGWGDLFFNFTDQDFTTANNQGDLFGVRFAGTNDSLVPNLGLYGNVTAISTTDINSGFSSLTDYNQRVNDFCQGADCSPSLGDLPADTSYFDQSQSLNTMGSGEFLTSLMYLSESELLAAGYDLNRFDGEHTIAFKFDKSGICDRGYCTSVPEPSAGLGLAALGLMVGVSQLRKRYSA
ncbi:XDD3 family exosortase-dependent surface protein [Coleofasciculus chthonoplastes]|uniref:XDD3 family exosortase-dependent surface protein n=1 Tax=Coleofasciculus chthonoplastes TaxID=64178 RepID=UPI0032F352E7